MNRPLLRNVSFSSVQRTTRHCEGRVNKCKRQRKSNDFLIGTEISQAALCNFDQQGVHAAATLGEYQPQASP